MANILLIEDDERVADVIGLHLGKRGHQICEARNGEHGLDRLRGSEAETVILDIRLPGMSGVEVLERIRERDGTLPVIILTGQVEVDLAVEVMKKGAFDFLTKPIKTAALLATVDKALAFKKLLDENARLLQENGNYQRNLERMVEQRTRELQDSQNRLLGLRSQMAHVEQLSMAGRMASAMAHEVKNPVVGVQGYAELMLLRGDLDGEVQEAFEVILSQCQRVSQIMTEFLHVTRPPAPDLCDTDLSATVQEILRLIQPYCLFRRITLRRSVEEGVRIHADASQLQQVLLNLLLNACHAMPDGGTLEAILTGTPDGGAEIAVKDSGVGIPEDQIPCVFQDFFSTRRDSQGTGLGLAISQELVARHGGRIEIESQEGVGSTFRVLLPPK